MKVILDSNIIIAAFSSRGLCHSVFELCLDRFTIILSEHILSEVFRNFTKKLKMPEKKVNLIIKYLREYCLVKDFEKLDESICRDTSDNNILALAKSSQPKYIITGDSDFLVLRKYNSIPIINPRKFWNISKKIGRC